MQREGICGTIGHSVYDGVAADGSQSVRMMERLVHSLTLAKPVSGECFDAGTGSACLPVCDVRNPGRELPDGRCRLSAIWCSRRSKYHGALRAQRMP